MSRRHRERSMFCERFRPHRTLEVGSMSVQFPCKDTTPEQGTPLRARPCRCDHQTLDEDGVCVMCGRLPAQTVDLTWAQQAWRNAKDQRPVRLRPYHKAFRDTERLERKRAA